MANKNNQVRARETRDLPIPAITDDAAERKRVLNVLAQRRYRKRRRERLQRLQAQVENQVEVRAGTDAAAAAGGGGEGLDHGHLNCQDLSLLSMPVAGRDNEPLAPLDVHPPPDLDQFFDFHRNPTAPDLGQDLSSQLQLSESSTFTFPDDHILEIPSLRLLNAAVKVAVRLNVAHLLWDVNAASPFYRSTHTPSSSLPSLSSTPSSSSSSDSELDLDVDLSLPIHLHPTRTQLLLPHHPVLDILPWPSTRDKLIQTFNLPAPVRPQSAQDPLGLLRLVYDMEDEGGEGVRVTGANVFDPDSWEIGQVVFQRWWWAFEAHLVQRWDHVRKARGESALAMRAGAGAATDADAGTV
ncbi:hypothetical protein BDV11DRAFT_212405 [Aspergillus similis]